MVERDEKRRETRTGEESSAGPVDPVLVGQLPVPRAVEAGEAVVDPVLLDAGYARPVRVDRPDDLIDVGRAAAAVVGVALQHDPLVGDPLGDVVRA